MSLFLIYIIRWAIALTLLYSLYGLFLRRETFHSTNRMVLVGILVMGMVLPLCHLPYKNALGQAMQHLEQGIVTSTAMMNVTEAEPTTSITTSTEEMSEEAPSLWFVIPLLAYMAGMLYCWSRYALACIALWHTISRSRRIQHPCVPLEVHLLVNDTVSVPCSWMNRIILSPTDLQQNGSMIIRHEMEHIRRRHSWDMLLADATVHMLWFLPFAHMLRTDLRDVHEYQADRAVLDTDVNEGQYQKLIIDKATMNNRTSIANSLNASAVKKRLAMMFRKESRRIARMKVLYILPLTAVVLMGFARPQIVDEVAQVIRHEEAKTEQMVQQAIEPILPHVEPEATPAEVEENTAVPEPATIAVEPELAITTSEATEPEPIEPAVTEIPVPTESTAVTDTTPVPTPRPADNPRLRGPMAEDGLPIIYDLPLNSNSNIEYAGMWLERRAKDCVLHFAYTCESDDEVVFLGDEETNILNGKTGVRYKCRGAVIPRTFGGKFHIRGMKARTVDLGLIFPLWPEDYNSLYVISTGIPNKQNFNTSKYSLERNN